MPVSVQIRADTNRFGYRYCLYLCRYEQIPTDTVTDTARICADTGSISSFKPRPNLCIYFLADSEQIRLQLRSDSDKFTHIFNSFKYHQIHPYLCRLLQIQIQSVLVVKSENFGSISVNIKNKCNDTLNDKLSH
jgi:hypothetical protein